LANIIFMASCFLVAAYLLYRAPRIAQWITNQQLYDRRRNYGGK